MVKESPTFPDAIKEFFTFLSSQTEQLTEDGFIINHNILVAHNGRRFDIRFLIQQLQHYGMGQYITHSSKFEYGIDTMELARKAIQNNPEASIPTSYCLSDLYQYMTGTTLCIAFLANSIVSIPYSNFELFVMYCPIPKHYNCFIRNLISNLLPL